jgi:hypothetical protein
MKNVRLRHPRMLAAATGVLALVGAAAVSTTPVDAKPSAGPQMARHVVIYSGLDNPRQLQRLQGGDFLVAEAGHGANDPHNCVGSGDNRMCAGTTGKVTRLRQGQATHVMTGLMSLAGGDGSFAVGSDGAGRFPGGPYYTIETWAPPSQMPPGLPAGQLGKLLSKWPGGTLHFAGNITRYERLNDPDGEGFDSDPYSVLVLNRQVLVADAAGDDILSVRNGHVRLWAALQEYGPKVDPVPTVLAKGPGGNILVGELHSEIPHQAHVWLYDRSGNRLRGWPGFTTITGVSRDRDGSLYVSELFGGTCGFNQIPSCFPGRVVKVAPDGTRTHVNVPFPAGIVAHLGRVYVNAFSVAPATGFGGNPDWSGQLWQVFP